jgi:bifunctional DNA-binding transcriptional regulator/antitoxin component of YhaV-PrlF toxin-antitoxin module
VTHSPRDPAVRVGPHGRVVIPAALRRRSGIDVGTTVVARGEPGRVVLETPEAVLARIRRRFDGAVGGPSVVDELSRERAAAAAADAADR